MLLTVLLPATNAPNPPMNGEKTGQCEPVIRNTPSAKAMGIRGIVSASSRMAGTGHKPAADARENKPAGMHTGRTRGSAPDHDSGHGKEGESGNG